MAEDRSLGKFVRWGTLLYAVVALLVLVFAASLIAVYALPRTNAWVGRIADRSPYPIALVGYTDPVSYRTLARNMASVRRFYEHQDFSQVGLRVDFTTPEGQQRFKVREKEVLNKMIEDEAIIRLARERGIVVSAEAARQEVNRKTEQYGSADEVRNNLDRLYGWSLADFEAKVVLPSLYQQKLEENFAGAVDAATAAHDRIVAAQEALRSGTAFDAVAKQYSQGQTAQNGGDLGWFSINDLAPELRVPVAAQNVGVAGDVVESSLGFHIVLVNEVKTENGARLYRLKQIFTRKVTFADWLTEQMKRMPITILSPEYRWNADTARADFRNPQMQTFEQNLLKNTSGDALFFF